MEQNGLGTIEYTLRDATLAQKQFEKLTQFHKLLVPGEFDLFPPTLSDRTIRVHINDALPNILASIQQNVIQTDQVYLHVDQATIALMRQFVGAFDPAPVVTITVPSDTEDTPDLVSCKMAILQVHRAWIEFLKSCVELLDGRREYFVVVGKDLSISIDGVLKEQLTSPYKRGLLILALLRNTQPFSAAEFQKLYSHRPGEPAKEFYKVFQVIKAELPALTYKADEGLRSVTGLEFRLLTDTGSIKAYLAKFYPSSGLQAPKKAKAPAPSDFFEDKDPEQLI